MNMKTKKDNTEIFKREEIEKENKDLRTNNDNEIINVYREVEIEFNQTRGL